VKDFKISHPYYKMLIDAREVDEAASTASAFAQLEARFEYEEHASDLEEARRRLRQVQERLEARYPRAAQDNQLLTLFTCLGDALGSGPEISAPEPASAPQGEGTFGRQISPELVVGTDSSQCIVLLVGGTGPKDPIRKVTVSDVDAFKAALDDARTAQHVALEGADAQRVPGIDEKRRSEGRLTRSEAVEWLIAKGHGRNGAVIVTAALREGSDEEFGSYGMSYDGTYWVVPPPDRRFTQAEAVDWVMAKTRSTRHFAVKTVTEAAQGSTPYGMRYEDGYWVVPA
jgi:hypothetical protein